MLTIDQLATTQKANAQALFSLGGKADVDITLSYNGGDSFPGATLLNSSQSQIASLDQQTTSVSLGGGTYLIHLSSSQTLGGPYIQRSEGCNPHFTNWNAYDASVFVCHHGADPNGCDWGGLYTNGCATSATAWIR